MCSSDEQPVRGPGKLQLRVADDGGSKQEVAMFRSFVPSWVLLAAFAACGVEGEPSPASDEAMGRDIAGTVQPDAQMYWTCGDPVCSGWVNKGLPKCRGREAGDACDSAKIGQECDPHDPCNATLMCSDVDPIDPTTGCPISRRAAKKDISYVDAAQQRALADQLLQVRLATYRYTQEDAGARTHLGFIIDDVLPSPAVAANGQQVDLYAYTSMTVAALQVQQQQIDALTRELEALRSAR